MAIVSAIKHKYSLALIALAFLVGFIFLDHHHNRQPQDYYEPSQLLSLSLKIAEQGDVESALLLISSAEAQDAANELQRGIIEAELLIQGLRYEDAVKTLLDLAQSYPNAPEVWNNLGVVFANLGEEDRASQAFIRALETDAIYSQVYRNMSKLASVTSRREYFEALGIEKTISLEELEILKFSILHQEYSKLNEN